MSILSKMIIKEIRTINYQYLHLYTSILPKILIERKDNVRLSTSKFRYVEFNEDANRKKVE